MTIRTVLCFDYGTCFAKLVHVMLPQDMLRGNVLLIGDSHMRFMKETLQARSELLSIREIWYPGAQINDITNIVHENIDDIYHYDPDYIMIQIGSNDISYHYAFNQSPVFATEVVKRVLTLAYALEIFLKKPRIFVGAWYPRVAPHRLIPFNHVAYNRAIIRESRVTRSLIEWASDNGYIKKVQMAFVDPLWINYTHCIGDASCFRLDGHHLVTKGHELVTDEWVDLMFANGDTEL